MTTLIPAHKTYWTRPADIRRAWHVIDAEGLVLGRLATKAANILQGKGKRHYSRQLDGGDCVIVTNARAVRLTGDKINQKIDFRHSGYPGGTTFTPYTRLMNEKPERAVELAVMGMLPKNKLRKRMIRRLFVYAGSEHPHGAQVAGLRAAEGLPGAKAS